jgi:hypothetical protein
MLDGRAGPTNLTLLQEDVSSSTRSGCVASRSERRS